MWREILRNDHLSCGFEIRRSHMALKWKSGLGKVGFYWGAVTGTMLISAHWKHKNSIHIFSIAPNAAVTTLFFQECIYFRYKINWHSQYPCNGNHYLSLCTERKASVKSAWKRPKSVRHQKPDDTVFSRGARNIYGTARWEFIGTSYISVDNSRLRMIYSPYTYINDNSQTLTWFTCIDLNNIYNKYL